MLSRIRSLPENTRRSLATALLVFSAFLVFFGWQATASVELNSFADYSATPPAALPSGEPANTQDKTGALSPLGGIGASAKGIFDFFTGQVRSNNQEVSLWQEVKDTAQTAFIGLKNGFGFAERNAAYFLEYEYEKSQRQVTP